MWTGENLEEAARRKVAWLIGVVVVLIIAAGGWYWYRSQHAPAPPPSAARPGPAPAPPSSEPQIAHPIPTEAADNAALPALNDSDQLAHDSLAGVLGKGSLEQFLVPQSIVRHIVVTIDNLPRKKVAIDLRPLKATPGQTRRHHAGRGDDAQRGQLRPLCAAHAHVVQAADVKSHGGGV